MALNLKFNSWWRCHKCGKTGHMFTAYRESTYGSVADTALASHASMSPECDNEAIEVVFGVMTE